MKIHLSIWVLGAMMLAGLAFAQDSLNVTRVEFIDTPEYALNATVMGNYVFVADREGGMRIIDITNPAIPTEVGFYDTPGQATAVAVVGIFAYVADLYSGLRVIDITNPAIPTEVGFYDTPGYANGVTVSGNYAYVADWYSGLRVIDIANPTTPTEVGSYDTPGTAYYVAVEGNYAYVGDLDYGLRIIDISNPPAPVEVGFYDTPGNAFGVAVAGDYAYVADVASGLRVIDISNPAAPTEVGFFDTPGSAYRIAVAGDYAYIADMGGGMRVIDIANPTAPVEVGFYVTPGNAEGVAANGNYAYVADGYNGLGIYDCTEAITPPCPPTPLPFIDNFDSPELDSCWYRVGEDTTHWGLTERPGWLTTYTQYNAPGDLPNALLRNVSAPQLRVQTKLIFAPGGDEQYAGIICYVPSHYPLRVWRCQNANVNRVTFQADEGSGTNWNVPCSQDTVWFRLDVLNHLTAAWYSVDSLNWNSMGHCITDWVPSEYMAVGLATSGTSQIRTPAVFDYFKVDSIPGTNVCGNVSGVWDSTGSPYYVTCDVTVPAEQTLEIQPGVQVLFTGHYKFNVYGNLQAIGTEQDSIVFTRAFPTEESKWWGVRFHNTSSASSMDYCVVEHSKATGGEGDGSGGGIFCWGSSPAFTHCWIRFCSGDYDGGGVYVNGGNPTFEECSVTNNVSAIYGGGISVVYASQPVFTRCLIARNTNVGILSGWGASTLIENCTIVENVTGGDGAGVYHAASGLTQVLNSILWGNHGGTQQVYGNINATFSDIQGGYPGIGNIDEDPLFFDPDNGDFHLTEDSPCIDSGDPNSPLDPDSTIADMGAFYYPQPNLLLTPTSLNFGLLDVGSDSTITISFYNPTVLPAMIDSMANTLTVFAIDTTGLDGQFNPQFTTDIPVTYYPTASGTYRDTIVIIASIAGNDTIRIPLRGEAAVIPMPVDSLVIKKGAMNGIELRWAPVTQTISGQPLNDVGYVIYGSIIAEGPFTPFGFTTSTTYQHPFILNTQEIYFYYVEPYVEGQREEAGVLDLIQKATTH